jgi:hypothetical protein
MADNDFAKDMKQEYSPERLQAYGGAIRDLISKENELYNMRISWLNTIQGLLFASLTFALGYEPDNKSKAKAITYVLGAVGILTALNTKWMTKQGGIAIKGLLSKWQAYVRNYCKIYPEWGSFEPVIGLRPGTEQENPKYWDVKNDGLKTFLEIFFLPGHPEVFVASWIAIIFITVYY